MYKTRNWVIDTFDGSALMDPKKDGRPNIVKFKFAAMDGGVLFIEKKNKQLFISKLAQLKESGDLRLSAVPVSADQTIFFADVDKIPVQGFDMNVLLGLLAEQFNLKATHKRKDVAYSNMLLTKRKNEEKYHIYIPKEFGEVSTDERQSITNIVNGTCEKQFGCKIIDPKALTIRIEGFLKFDTANKRYENDSEYVPIGEAKEMSYAELLDAVWINPKECTIANPSGDAVLGNLLGNILNDADDDEDVRRNLMSMPLRALPGPDNDDNKDPSENNTEVRPSVAESRARTPDTYHANVTDKIAAQVRRDFPGAAHEILKYPVIDVKKGPGGHWATFMCDKSEDGRKCKIAGRVHSRNNIYLHYHKSKGVLEQRCFGCNNQAEIVWKKGVPLNHKRVKRAKELGLPSAGDMQIAEHFMLWKPYVQCTGTGSKLKWYVYAGADEGGPGVWQSKDQDYIIGLVLDPFKKYLQKKFRKAIEDAGDDDAAEELERDWTLLNGKLSTVNDLKNLATAIRYEIRKKGQKIEWNQKDCYTVFTNGVLQLDKTHEEYPELPYFFGPTAPEEYINDDRCWGTPFNCPPVNNDLHYFYQAEQLQREWIDLVQPEADDKCLLLMFIALTLLTVNYKKMILNIGSSGDNAKSSFFEMCVFLMGSYGVIGDKKLIVRGKKDRVSEAMLNCVRFILFEEPDAGKPIDIEFIKV